MDLAAKGDTSNTLFCSKGYSEGFDRQIEQIWGEAAALSARPVKGEIVRDNVIGPYSRSRCVIYYLNPLKMMIQSQIFLRPQTGSAIQRDQMLFRRLRRSPLLWPPQTPSGGYTGYWIIYAYYKMTVYLELNPFDQNQWLLELHCLYGWLIFLWEFYSHSLEGLLGGMSRIVEGLCLFLSSTEIMAWVRFCCSKNFLV